MAEKFHSEATSGGEALDLKEVEKKIVNSAEAAASPSSSGVTGTSEHKGGVDATDEILSSAMGGKGLARQGVGMAASVMAESHNMNSSFMPGQPGGGKAGHARTPIVPMGYAEKVAMNKRDNREAYKAGKAARVVSKDPLKSATGKAAAGSAPVTSSGAKAAGAGGGAKAAGGGSSSYSSADVGPAGLSIATLSGEAQKTLHAVRVAQDDPQGARLVEGIKAGHQDALNKADQMMETDVGERELKNRAPVAAKALHKPAAPTPPGAHTNSSDKDKH